MFKNLILLVALSWFSLSHAKDIVAHDHMTDAENFKVEKSVEEQEAQRSVAGDKIKRNKKHVKKEMGKDAPTGDSDSEVRYWQYQE